jgi:hypothetical protein
MDSSISNVAQIPKDLEHYLNEFQIYFHDFIVHGHQHLTNEEYEPKRIYHQKKTIAWLLYKFPDLDSEIREYVRNLSLYNRA